MAVEGTEEAVVYELLSRLPVAVLVADADGRYLYANPVACELLGRQLEEVLELTIQDVSVEGFDFEAAWRRFHANKSQAGDFVIRRPDGREVPVEFRAIANLLPGRHVSILTEVEA